MPIGQGKFLIQRKATRKDGWTVARRKLFLDTLAYSANATMAARAAGMSVDTARALRRRDAEFAQLWAEALEDGAQRLREEMIAQQLGQLPSGDNPADERMGECPTTAAALLDPIKALAALKAFEGFGHGRRRNVKPATQAEVDKALMARLEALAIRMIQADERAAARNARDRIAGGEESA